MIIQGHICNDCGELIEGSGETLEDAQAQLKQMALVHEMICDHRLLKNDMAYMNAQYDKKQAKK